MKREILRRHDAEGVAHAAADAVALAIESAINSKGQCSLALAGGTTPRRAYEILAAEHRTDVPWHSVQLFWGDERCVAPDAPDSNYAMAKAALLDRVGFPLENVHRIRGELGAQAAADDYERELSAFFGSAPKLGFDLVLLGMGEDGHTASLFPGNVALAETRRWAVPVETEAKAPRWRVSLTLPALCAAQQAIFLVTGAGKHVVLSEILADPDDAALHHPAAAVRPWGGVLWIIDDDAFEGASR